MENKNEKEIEQVKRVQKIRDTVFALSDRMEALSKMVDLYKSILFKRVAISAENVKAVQSSIVELCTGIIDLVKEV